MSERFVGLLNDTQKSALNDIEQTTLERVDSKYSTGFPHYRGASSEALLYHNGLHARMVGKGALKVARAVGLTGDSLAIVQLAGYAHDMYQGKGHEEESAEWLKKELQDNGLPQNIAHMASLAIRGTQPLFENGVITGQIATEQRYPTKEAEVVALAVASADLGSLHTSFGPLLAHDLYREIKNDHSPAIDDGLLHFQQKQMEMLETYQYPLVKADELLATHRPEVKRYHGHMLAQLEQGDIEDWQQLRAQDEAFYRRHQ